MTQKSVWERASRLASLPHVAARMRELRAEAHRQIAQARHYELENAMDDCARLQRIIDDDPHRHVKAFLGLIRLKAELNGLLVEARRNERSPVSDMGADEVKAALTALAAIRKAQEKTGADGRKG